VFNVQAYTGNSITGRFFNTGFDGDLSFCFNRTINSAPFYNIVIDRLRGNRRLFTGDTSAEVTDASLIDWFNKKSNNVYVHSNGTRTNDSSYTYWLPTFRRAPGFFDVVAYTGNTTSGRIVNHNLKVAPELIITKTRSGGYVRGWAVYHKDVYSDGDKSLFLDTSAAAIYDGVYYPSTPNSTSYTLGIDAHVNNSANIYIAYLFATLTLAFPR
jgi:hypothetical protein